MREDQINHIVPRVVHLEGEFEQMQKLIRGDGKSMGIGPLVLKHEVEISGDDGLKKDVRKLQDQALKIAIYTGVAVTIAMTLAPILIKLISKAI